MLLNTFTTAADISKGFNKLGLTNKLWMSPWTSGRRDCKPRTGRSRLSGAASHRPHGCPAWAAEAPSRTPLTRRRSRPAASAARGDGVSDLVAAGVATIPVLLGPLCSRAPRSALDGRHISQGGGTCGRHMLPKLVCDMAITCHWLAAGEPSGCKEAGGWTVAEVWQDQGSRTASATMHKRQSNMLAKVWRAPT